LDEALTSTLEMKSYSRTGPGRIVHVRSEEASVVATVRDVAGSNCSKNTVICRKCGQDIHLLPLQV